MRTDESNGDDAVAVSIEAIEYRWVSLIHLNLRNMASLTLKIM